MALFLQFIFFIFAGKLLSDISLFSSQINIFKFLGKLSNNVILFLNGFEIPSTLDSNGDTDYMANVDITDDLGRRMKPTEYGDGIFDEVRWSKVLRSNEWIESTYNTINDPSNFFNVGPDQSHP